MLGYTSGGSPIYDHAKSRFKQQPHGKTLYECSHDPKHKLTKNQAKSSGFMCTHCGFPLKVKAHKIHELEVLAKTLGAKIVWSKSDENS